MMARMEQDGPNGLPGKSEESEIIRAGGQDRIELPDSAFIADADIARDGADLILRAPDGHAITIEGYFNTDPAPVLTAPGGAHLSPALVDSFVRADGPAQYAQGEGGNDVSPVGFVKEISGHATVAHADGTIENVTIGTPVFEGDIVETDAAGAVNIRFVDESSFAVSANARLAVDEYIFDGAGGDGGASSFSLLRGMFVYTSGLIGREDPDDVKIETPVGSIGIRGTTIAGHINPDGESQITVTEGAIVIHNGAGEQTLSHANETVRITGYDSAMEHAGVLDSAQIAHDYTVLRVVAPDFFTAIGNDVPDRVPETAPETHDAAPAVPAAPEAPPPASQQDGMIMLSPEQNFDGTLTEFAAVTAEEPLSSPASQTAAAPESVVFAPPPVMAAPANNYVPPSAPPSVIAGGNGTVTTTPFILNLNAIGGDGIVIAGAAGARLGASVAAWGDGNHDQFDDFLVGNDLSSGGSAFLYNGALSALAAIPGTPSSMAVVAGIGDFDGDGQIDYAAGVPNSNSGAANGGGATIFNSGGPVILNNMAAGQHLG
ncbi:MAG TPA: FecR domain-containing protein, partial [Alphaproteobacteria bacterium]